MIVIDIAEFQKDNIMLDINPYTSIFDEYWYQWMQERQDSIYMFCENAAGRRRKMIYSLMHVNIMGYEFLKIVFKNPEDEMFFKLGFS